MNSKVNYLIITALLILGACAVSKDQEKVPIVITTNSEIDGQSIQIELITGKEYNHPTMAFWIEDLEGNFIQTLYVTKYIASGVFGNGEIEPGKWDNKPGELKRPSTLPYWLHKKGAMADGSFLPSPKNPVIDAITAASPKTNFILNSTAGKNLPSQFRILMEINQAWDSNKTWNNNIYPENQNYKASCQPALVYAVVVNTENLKNDYYLNPIGHSHFAGDDGELYTNLNTITTALEIVEQVVVRLK